MNRPVERLQNIISTVVIVLLVTQTVLLIFVLMDLRSFRQLASSGTTSQAEPVELLVGTQAPDFQLSDVDGSLHSLAEYKGNTVLLVFTSHTCRYCREMYPGLREFTRDNTSVKVLLLAANSVDENLAFLDEFSFSGFENLHVLAATPEVFKEYSVIGTPTLVVVDEQGVIVNTGYATTAEQVSGLISK